MFLKIPQVVRIARSQTIAASPETLYPYINEPRRIQEWSPFMDAKTVVSYSGAVKGVGAQWAWKGRKAGEGQATITESDAYRRVGLRLDFKKPFHVTNAGEYLLKATASGTEITWAVDETAWLPRFLSCFMDLDRMVGSMFQAGLDKLKVLVESH